MIRRNTLQPMLAALLLLSLGGCSGTADLLGPDDNNNGNNGGGNGGVAIHAALTCYPAPFAVNQLMTFDATGSWSHSDPMTFDWDFDGDGTYEITGGTDKTPKYTPPADGNFTAKVRATDSIGNSAVATKDYTVQKAGDDSQKLLNVGLTIYPAPFKVGQDATFDATTAWAKEEPITFSWDFDGDGSFDITDGSDATENYKPRKSGNFTGRVRIKDAAGRTAEAQRSYKVESEDGTGGGGDDGEYDVDGPPVAKIGAWPTSGAAPLEVHIDAASSWSKDGKALTKIEYDLDGDGTFETEKPNPKEFTYTFTEAGDFDIATRVTAPNGKSTVSDKITIKVQPEGSGGSYDVNGPPVAQLGAWPTSGVAPLEVHLDSGGSWSKDGKPLTKYEYDLDGDGTFETTKPNGKEFIHIFTTAGAFNVATRVTSPNGKTAIDAKTITVSPAPSGGGNNGGGNNGGGDDDPVDPTDLHFDPVAVLIASDVLVNVGDEISFDASSSIDPLGKIVLFEWDMDGDGEFELSGPNLTSQTYSFSEAGIHIVTMRVTDDEGNQGQYPSYIIVQESGAP